MPVYSMCTCISIKLNTDIIPLPLPPPPLPLTHPASGYPYGSFHMMSYCIHTYWYEAKFPTYNLVCNEVYTKWPT